MPGPPGLPGPVIRLLPHHHYISHLISLLSFLSPPLVPTFPSVVGRLISLSGTEEIMQNLVKITHSSPICELRDDIPGFARLQPSFLDWRGGWAGNCLILKSFIPAQFFLGSIKLITFFPAGRQSKTRTDG